MGLVDNITGLCTKEVTRGVYRGVSFSISKIKINSHESDTSFLCCRKYYLCAYIYLSKDNLKNFENLNSQHPLNRCELIPDTDSEGSITFSVRETTVDDCALLGYTAELIKLGIDFQHEWHSDASYDNVETILPILCGWINLFNLI